MDHVVRAEQTQCQVLRIAFLLDCEVDVPQLANEVVDIF